jgi:hypothetical protein
MKKLLYSLLLIVTGLASAFPESTCRLAWDPVYSDEVIGYRIHYRTELDPVGTYTQTMFVPGQETSTATISNLVAGVVYYFVATSVGDSMEESEYSNECSYSVDAIGISPPQDFRFYNP